MRLTDFWGRMHRNLGEGYAESFARDFVLEELGSRTVEQALASGMDVKQVWRVVCDAMGLPAKER